MKRTFFFSSRQPAKTTWTVFPFITYVTVAARRFGSESFSGAAGFLFRLPVKSCIFASASVLTACRYRRVQQHLPLHYASSGVGFPGSPAAPPVTHIPQQCAGTPELVRPVICTYSALAPVFPLVSFSLETSILFYTISQVTGCQENKKISGLPLDSMKSRSGLMRALSCAPGPPRRPAWPDIQMSKPHIPVYPREPNSSSTADTYVQWRPRPCMRVVEKRTVLLHYRDCSLRQSHILKMI